MSRQGPGPHRPSRHGRRETHPGVPGCSCDQRPRIAKLRSQRLPSAGSSSARRSVGRSYPWERQTTWTRHPRRSSRSSKGVRGQPPSSQLSAACQDQNLERATAMIDPAAPARRRPSVYVSLLKQPRANHLAPRIHPAVGIGATMVYSGSVAWDHRLARRIAPSVERTA